MVTDDKNVHGEKNEHLIQEVNTGRSIDQNMGQIIQNLMKTKTIKKSMFVPSKISAIILVYKNFKFAFNH